MTSASEIGRFFEAVRSIPGMLSNTFHEARWCIAGSKVRFIFANPKLEARFSLALEHHPTWQGSDDLKVFVLDRESAADYWPNPPWQAQGVGAQALISWEGLISPGVKIVEGPDRSGTVEIIDSNRGVGYVLISDIDLVPDWYFAMPCRNLFSLWFRHRGLFVVHGAGIALGNFGVLVVSLPGRGKSTTALACLTNKMDFLGDDYVLIGVRDQNLVAFGVYASAVLREGNDVVQFSKSDVPTYFDKTRNARILCFSRSVFQGSMRSSAVIKAILLPQQSNGIHCSLAPAAEADVVAAWLTTNACFIPHFDQAYRTAMRTFIARADLRRLMIPADPAALAAIVRDYLLTFSESGENLHSMNSFTEEMHTS